MLYNRFLKLYLSNRNFLFFDQSHPYPCTQLLAITILFCALDGIVGDSISWLMCIMLQWTWEGRCAFSIMILFILDIYLVVWLLERLVALFLIFQKNHRTAFHVYTIHIVTNNLPRSPFHYIFVYTSYYFYDSYFNRC